jgi:hypothetical protein
MHTGTVIAASGAQSAVALFFDLIATVVIFVALVRILATPNQRWAHGWLSKLAWIIATVWFTPYLGLLVLPVGALAAIWKTHDLRSKPGPDPLQVPFAEGNPVTEEDDAR